MEIRDLPPWIETQFTFPVTANQIKAQAGDVEIEAPDQADSESLTTILDRSEDARYRSASELLDTIRGNLKEEYIGRKYYDDRGGAPSQREPSQTGETLVDEESF